MYDFKAMSIFSAVVEAGSMQLAAEKLAMTPSAVTQAVQKLEKQLNIKLLSRTTRKLSLTEAGEAFYQHVSGITKSAENAVKSIELLRSNPAGQLNIACVTGLMDSLFVKVFKSVLDAHPDFQLNVIFEDRFTDLLDKRIDIALRAGEGVLTDNMIARLVHTFNWKIVAHKDYFQNKPLPKSLEELAQLDWISFSNPRFNSLKLKKQQEAQEIIPDYRIRCNTLYASRRLTMSGLGVSLQPDADVQKGLNEGELIELFPEWQLPPIPLYLITLQRVQSEKVRIACELITHYFEAFHK